RTATITFSEAMDLTSTPTISNNAGTTLTNPTNGHWVDATHYAIDYTVVDANLALANITFNVSGARDAAGNTQTAATNVATGTAIDTANPTVVVNIVATSLTGSQTSQVTFEFSENVTGFGDAGDVTVTGGMLSAISSVDGNSYTATFTPTPGFNGTASVTVN